MNLSIECVFAFFWIYFIFTTVYVSLWFVWIPVNLSLCLFVWLCECLSLLCWVSMCVCVFVLNLCVCLMSILYSLYVLMVMFKFKHVFIESICVFWKSRICVCIMFICVIMSLICVYLCLGRLYSLFKFEI